MKRYKFQALVTLDPPATGAARAAVHPGQTRRMVVRGEHHDTHDSQIFSALVTPGEDLLRPGDHHIIMTVSLAAPDPSEYFEIGDHFALWLGGDIGHGVVTRRLFI